MSITDKIKSRIKRRNRGWVFAPGDFLDVGTRDSVDQVLSRLVKSGMIRRLDRGIYDYPKQSKLFGTLPPDLDSVAKVLASGDDISPSGARAANILGLSTQVPAQPVYLTNATNCTRTVGNYNITLKRAKVPLFRNVPDKINLVLQALSYLGKDDIDNSTIDRCASILSNNDASKLHDVMTHVPGWLSDTLHKIENVRNGQIHSTA